MVESTLFLTLLLLCSMAIHCQTSNRTPAAEKVNLSGSLEDNWQHTDLQKQDGKVILPPLKLKLPPPPKLPRVPVVIDIPERSREDKRGKQSEGQNVFFLLAAVLGVAAVSRVGMGGCKKIRIHKNRVLKSFYKYEPQCKQKISSQICPDEKTHWSQRTCNGGNCENTCVVRASATNDTKMLRHDTMHCDIEGDDLV